MKHRLLALLILVGGVALPRLGEARVVRCGRADAAVRRRKSFGSAGPFVRLEGTASFEVDPKDPLNALIVNLDKAPRNAKGMVEFSTPFVIIKPVDMARGQPEDPLRHQQPREPDRAARFISFRAGATAPEGGDGLLYRLGYTVRGRRVGRRRREHRRPPRRRAAGGRAAGRAPHRRDDPRRVRGGGSQGYTVPLKGNTAFRSYETADTDTRASILTVRDSIGGQQDAHRVRPLGVRPLPDGKGVARADDARICACSTVSAQIASTS